MEGNPLKQDQWKTLSECVDPSTPLRAGSLTTADLHPTDQDLSVGTPTRRSALLWIAASQKKSALEGMQIRGRSADLQVGCRAGLQTRTERSTNPCVPYCAAGLVGIAKIAGSMVLFSSIFFTAMLIWNCPPKSRSSL